MNAVIIGYGNTLCRDDAVGPKVAEAIDQLSLPGVQTFSRPLLTPELAAPIAEADLAVFVDASVDAPRLVRLRPLKPAESSEVLGHASTPGILLALARDLFNAKTEAWWLTIPATDLELGEGLSPAAEIAMNEALDQLHQLLLKHKR